MMIRNWTLVSVFATLAVASWAQPPAAPPQEKPDAPPRVQNAPNNAEIPQAVRERVREQIQKRTGRTPDVAPKADDQLVRPGQADSAPVQARPEQTDKPDATKRTPTSRNTPEASTPLPRGPQRDQNEKTPRQPSDAARPKADTPKSTPVTSNRATPKADTTPFVPKDMPEHLRRDSDKETPASKATKAIPSEKVGTPSSVKAPSDILPESSSSAPGDKPTAPPTAPPKSSDRPGASKPPTTGNKPPTTEKPDAPATPAPSPTAKPAESPKPAQSPTPAASPSPAAKTPVTAAPTPKTAAPSPSPSPATSLPVPEVGKPTATPSTEAGREAAERRKDRKVITIDEANTDNLNQAAETLLGKRPKPSNPGTNPTGTPPAPKLTPWIAPSVTDGKESTGKPGSIVMPPPGATPTPTPAPDTIRVSDRNKILDNIKDITLAPTPPPAPTPGATPVATPPGVTPVPSNFRPKRDWVPYPGWRPQKGWKPPKGWTPPGGWTPPPGWDPPREWVPRLRQWGWNYIPQRGWVVPVQWTPPPDFTVPPGWYYLPSSAYNDYGFYDPSEVVVLPGYARPDLQININMNQVYRPPAPPPAQVINLPPPPPRPAPPEPPRMPAQITSVETVAQILSRPRDPNGPRYQGPVLVTGSVHFDFDSYAIRPDSFPTLDAIGQALVTEMPDAIINVEGHTDAKGTDEYNQTLSEQRAWSVKSYLVQKFGLDPNRLIIVGYGERAPIAENETEAGRALNRRVEFENVTDLYKAQVVETAQPQ